MSLRFSKFTYSVSPFSNSSFANNIKKLFMKLNLKKKIKTFRLQNARESQLNEKLVTTEEFAF